MYQLHKLYQDILDYGIKSDDRTGTGTIKLVGQQMRFDLSKGFPAVTTKKLAWKAMLSELLWFLEGSQDERRLCEILHGTRDPSKRTIWTDNYENQAKALGYADGNLGPVYGKQWRFWDDYVVLDNNSTLDEYTDNLNKGYVVVAEETSPMGVTVLKRSTDQIQVLIDGLRNDPYSRRHILNAWNVGELDRMALPPCHSFSQFIVTDGKLNCILTQRSADVFLGVSFNIASYSLLTHILAKLTNLEVGEFIWNGGDCHIYNNHIDQVHEQLRRTPHELPTLIMKDFSSIEELTMDSFHLENYNPDAPIKAQMAI